MEKTISDFKGLIDLWATPAEFARAVLDNADYSNLNPGRIWYRRNRVPKVHFPQVLKACKTRNLEGVDEEALNLLWARGAKQGK